MPDFSNAGATIRHLLHPPEPVIVSQLPSSSSLFLAGNLPLVTPLVFENEASDARDHCANERNFMSFLRLSMSLYVVGLAILFSFSFSFAKPPSEIEKAISLPLGIIFIVLSLVCLGIGVGTYTGTIKKYSKRKALVESGRLTSAIMAVLAVSICVTCLILIATGAESGGIGDAS